MTRVYHDKHLGVDRGVKVGGIHVPGAKAGKVDRSFATRRLEKRGGPMRTRKL